MPRLQLDFYCSKCHTPICFHGTVKDHAGHDWGLLTDVVSNHTAELCTEAERVSVMQTKLEQGIARIKVVEEELVVETRTQKENITAHFAHLVEVLRAREQELMREVEETQARKQKILAGQREGLEHAVASMASGSEHARRTSKLGDVFEVMLAYSHIVGGMRAICDKDYQLHPNTSASIRFVDTSGGSMSESLAQHARIVAREVRPAACTAEGGGLKEIFINHTAEFTVQAVDFQGQACTEGGDTVQIKLCGAGDRQVLGHADLTKDAGVVDRGDGTYGCTYSIVAGAQEKEALLEVLLNGGHVSGSPFTLAITKGVELKFEAPFDTKGVLQYIATDGGKRAYSNPHDAGLVVASMSSVAKPQHSQPMRFVQGASHDDQYNMTNNVAGSWMAVDLKRPLAATHYCLRSTQHVNGHKLRNWRLEGSNDGSSWSTLREHANDTSLTGTVSKYLAAPCLCFAALACVWWGVLDCVDVCRCCI